MNTVLINVSYLVEIEDEKLDADEEAMDLLLSDISDKISKDVNVDVGTNYELGWVSTTTQILDSTTSNCGKCAKCGILVTDMEKPDPIEGLCNGATSKDQLLCEECLPIGHKWSL
jgi:hypothetical protein